MIEYIRGSLAELSPTQAVIEAAGIGYEVFISLNTYSAIQGKDAVKLFIHEAVRQDQASALYGFSTRQEREIFLLLLGVSGIGGQTARMILSAFTPAELANCIASEDANTLKAVKGIGPKAASRIIVDLKDKMAKGIWVTDTNSNGTTPPPNFNREVADEAVAALTMLGFPPAPSHKTVLSILQKEPETSVENIIKQALKML